MQSPRNPGSRYLDILIETVGAVDMKSIRDVPGLPLDRGFGDALAASGLCKHSGKLFIVQDDVCFKCKKIGPFLKPAGNS